MLVRLDDHNRYRNGGIMQNIAFKIKDNVLTIQVDLTQTIGASKSRKNEVIASTHGTLLLHDGENYRSESMNLTVTRRPAGTDGPPAG